MKIYIAGPIKGMPGYNEAAFQKAKDYIEALGNEAVSPFDLSKQFGTTEEIQNDKSLLDKVMRFEKKKLLDCDAIYMLAGWHESEGAKKELAWAIFAGLQIYLQTFWKQWPYC